MLEILTDKRRFGKTIKDIASRLFYKYLRGFCNLDSYRVLMYHSVGEIDPRDTLHTRVSERAFKEQLSFLISEGYDVLNLEDVVQMVLNSSPMKSKTVSITFDDGYRDNLDNAMPLMEQHKITATIFITPALLGQVKTKRSWQRWAYLTDKDVRCLILKGNTIGSHSLHHLNLNRLQKNEAENQINKSKEILENITGRKINGFSFPYGRYKRELLILLKKAGYRYACTVACGSNHPLADELYTIKRVEINGFDNLKRFKMKLDGYYDWLGILGMGV